MMRQRLSILTVLTFSVVVISASLAVSQEKPKIGYKDTPMLPGGKWRVHDGDRPQPPIVTPGTSSTQEEPGRPPSDAVVLFDGKDLSHWHDGKGGPARWKIGQGGMVIEPGTGVIVSKDDFGDCQLHLEWASPTPPKGRDQGRGNSGLMFFGRYEMQILDNFDNITYADGQAGAVYGQTPPLVNAARKPGEWQTYDVMFTVPRFKEDGTLESPAFVTTLLNGVLVQNHTRILGPMAFRALPNYKAHGPKGAILLQDHGNPIRFRNIWVREIKNIDQP